MSGVPVLVEVQGLGVLVVGGGRVAARKAAMLCDAGARVRVVAPEIGGEVSALAAAGRLTVERRAYREGDVGDAALVIAATDVREVNAQVGEHARAAGRLANIADAPSEGAFATMATHRAGALVVGVSAGAPAAAARIRDAIAARFDHRYAQALEELSGLRGRLLARGEAVQWRRASTELADAGFCESVESGTFARRMQPWR